MFVASCGHRTANAIHTIAAVKLVIGTDCVEHNVSGLCAP